MAWRMQGLTINPAAEVIHGTSLRREAILDMKTEVEDLFSLLDTTPYSVSEANRRILHDRIKALLDRLDEPGVLTAGGDQMTISSCLVNISGILSIAPIPQFLNEIDRVLDNILPYAAAGGHRGRSSRRTTRRHRSRRRNSRRRNSRRMTR